MGYELVAAGAAVAAIAASTSIAAIIDSKNRRERRRQREWERNAWMLEMLREDMAVQRRAADLKKAGLSPTLAAGSAATTASPIKSEPPQYDNYLKDVPNQVLSAVGAATNIDRTAAEADAIRTNKLKLESDMELQDYQKLKVASEIKGIDVETWKRSIEAQKMKRDLELSKLSGTASDPSQFGKTIRDFMGGLKNSANTIRGGVNGILNKSNTPRRY